MVFKKIQTLALFLLSSLIITKATTLCNYAAKSKYQNLINQYPDFKDEFDIMSNYPLPIWYTDRDEVKSSLNLTLHQVPRALTQLNMFVSQIVSIIMLQESVNLNGSDINLDRHKCFTV